MLATMSEDEVKTAVVLQLGQKEAYFCFDGVMKLTAFWWKCVDITGDYTDK